MIKSKIFLACITVIAVLFSILFILNINGFFRSCDKCLDDFEVRRYEKIGSNGVGDAYLVIADNIVETGRTDLGDDMFWRDKALMAGSTRQNMAYADTLWAEAKRLPENSASRKALIDEATRRLKIAVRNSFLMVQYDDKSINRRRHELDIIDKIMVEMSTNG